MFRECWFVESIIITVHLRKENNRPFVLVVHWFYSTIFPAGSYFQQLPDNPSCYALILAYYTAGRLPTDDLKATMFRTIYHRTQLSKTTMPRCPYFVEQQAPERRHLFELLLDQVALGIATSIIKLDNQDHTESRVGESVSRSFQGGGSIASSVVKRIETIACSREQRTLFDYRGVCKRVSTGKGPHSSKRQWVEKL